MLEVVRQTMMTANWGREPDYTQAENASTPAEIAALAAALGALTGMLPALSADNERGIGWPPVYVGEPTVLNIGRWTISVRAVEKRTPPPSEP